MKQQLLKAIDLALENNWEAAHSIVQQYEDDPTAAWIHAVLHKIEGDAGNSQYWYRRAGQVDRSGKQPEPELRDIRSRILGVSETGPEAAGSSA